MCAAQLYAAYDVVIIGVLLRLRTRAGRGAGPPGRGARGGRTFNRSSHISRDVLLFVESANQEIWPSAG